MTVVLIIVLLALMALRLTADLRLQYCLLREDNTIDLADRND